MTVDKRIVLREQGGRPVDVLRLSVQDGLVRCERSYRLKMPGGHWKPVKATGTAKNLTGAVAGALGLEAPTSKAMEIVSYIRATSWGMELP